MICVIISRTCSIIPHYDVLTYFQKFLSYLLSPAGGPKFLTLFGDVTVLSYFCIFNIFFVSLLFIFLYFHFLYIFLKMSYIFALDGVAKLLYNYKCPSICPFFHPSVCHDLYDLEVLNSNSFQMKYLGWHFPVYCLLTSEYPHPLYF